jgi:uncharacterized protein Yka (UPF0111/DUF47 family)
MYRRHSRNSKTTKIENLRKHKNKRNSIEALYKHQSETGNTINKEINELRMKIDNIKKEMTQDMEKERNRIAKQMESQSSE